MIKMLHWTCELLDANTPTHEQNNRELFSELLEYRLVDVDCRWAWSCWRRTRQTSDRSRVSLVIDFAWSRAGRCRSVLARWPSTDQWSVVDKTGRRTSRPCLWALAASTVNNHVQLSDENTQRRFYHSEIGGRSLWGHGDKCTVQASCTKTSGKIRQQSGGKPTYCCRFTTLQRTDISTFDFKISCFFSPRLPYWSELQRLSRPWNL